ncbi:S41 family peptidase [Paenibacillus abyssi]|uniref:Carboxy-terminal processing protease CtpA n=1 Tax=Paenibacillus abyssi TaxID=1340531 RepID=A0A917D123_9BACL|nr:S41 family peptidase [Paenibacillus abyssi]GGG04683.1 carboxy-terminal processing protease CtpA [Paenibacillus abyssi]
MYTSHSKTRQQRIIVIIIAVAIIAGLGGFAGGRWWMMNRYPMLQEPAFDNLDRSYKEVLSDYLSGADPDELIHGAAQGLVSSLKDPYSVYYTKEQGADYLQRYEDHFVGIGVELRVENGEFVISSAIKGAPAEQAGFQPDDVIAAVDGKSLKGKTLPDLIKLTRGKEGTEVTLTIVRAGLPEPFDITLKRASVPVTTVSSELLEGGIGTIQISRFAESTAEEFNRAADALLKQGMKGLVLDLRMNPGGLLSPAIDIASRLVPNNKVIVQVVYKDDKREITHRSKQKEPWEIPVVVLINESSASSAEVLASALKYSAGAEVVGVKSFGKGIVQTFQQFRDQSVLKLTEAQWRTPDGGWIQNEGIEPTIEVEMPEYAFLPALPLETELAIGEFGQEVKTAQQMLAALGFYAGEAKGIYDEATAAAVERFQREEKLQINGMLSGRTSYRLTQRLREKIVQEDPQKWRAITLLKDDME